MVAASQIGSPLRREHGPTRTRARTQTRTGRCPRPAVVAAASALAILAGARPAQTEEAPLVLPLPNECAMEFRFVPIGAEGLSPLAGRRTFLGRLGNNNFDENWTASVIGGAFHTGPGGRELGQWGLFMGVVEVTEEQYYSIVEPARKVRSKKPVTELSYFDVQEFIERLNEHLYKQRNRAELLPAHDGCLGFLRLPTEPEWEFCARGGASVPREVFEKDYPYAGAVEEYENFKRGGSVARLLEAGRKKPGPAGLCDMLGNVKEMTCTLYQVEYYQGRTGGFVVKGGCYTDPRDKIRAGSRAEYQFYNSQRDYQPSRSDQIGFRLVMACMVNASITSYQELEKAWAEYLESPLRKGSPAHLGTSGSSLTRATAGLTQAQDLVKQIRSSIGVDNARATVLLDQLGQNFGGIIEDTNKAKVEKIAGRLETASLVFADIFTLTESLATQREQYEKLKELRRETAERVLAIIETNEQKRTRWIAYYGERMEDACQDEEEWVLKGWGEFAPRLDSLPSKFNFDRGQVEGLAALMREHLKIFLDLHSGRSRMSREDLLKKIETDILEKTKRV